MDWFQVDKEGLARLLDGRGKESALYELVQNCWDSDAKTVIVTLDKPSGSRYVTLRVVDDDPHGFADLSHAFTLFAESTKKGDTSKRGRFNLGEKLVLALCSEAEIRTVSGGVRFDKDGRHTLRKGTFTGSVFEGRIKMTAAEYEECCEAMRRLIPPAGVITTFNGEHLEHRDPLATIANVSLATEIADEEGYLRRTTRQTTLLVFEPLRGERGTLYEMGIPVVETGDRFHVVVQQKVPLNFNRDNVPAAYLRDIRTEVLNAIHHQITDSEQANAAWVRDALADENVAAEAVEAMVELRFGDKAVTYDPSDPEANNLAVSKGYTVVTGSVMSKQEWANVRKAGVLLPAGRVTPSSKPFSLDGKPLKTLDPAKWSASEVAFAAAVDRISEVLVGVRVGVTYAIDFKWPFSAAYGKGSPIIFNKARLGAKFFEEMGERQIGLIIHELGHHFSGNHLSEQYHDALTDLGARLALAVAKDPSLIELVGQNVLVD